MSDIECQCNGSSQTVCSTCYIDLLQQLATLTQERDALRASLANLVRDGNWLLTHLGDDGMAGETAALDFGMSLEESEQLLTPSGEADKGGGV